MGKLESVDIILGILYATGAITLLIASYMLFIKRFKRSKLESISEVKITGSRTNTYRDKTQLLIETSKAVHIVVDLLDEHEIKVEELLDTQVSEGETILNFDPTKYANGNYYLYLKSDNATILRKIRIEQIEQ
jgi:hypothetical protein